MRVLAKKLLRDFWGKHADSEEQLKIWYKEASKANKEHLIPPKLSKQQIKID